jgi:hypothetical protein
MAPHGWAPASGSGTADTPSCLVIACGEGYVLEQALV